MSKIIGKEKEKKKDKLKVKKCVIFDLMNEKVKTRRNFKVIDMRKEKKGVITVNLFKDVLLLFIIK